MTTVVQFPNSTEFIARPAKLMRISAVANAMLEEARSAPPMRRDARSSRGSTNAPSTS